MISSRLGEVRVLDIDSGKVLFARKGIDPYWSPNGERLIFLRDDGPVYSVAVAHVGKGEIRDNVAPIEWGEYPSWAATDRGDLIVAIEGRYYYLPPSGAATSAMQVPECPKLGRGLRPLVSDDGRRLTVFAPWPELVIRNLSDCNDLVFTGLIGAKADFSRDGRWVATHVMKDDETGYTIKLLNSQTLEIVDGPALPGTSLFPSWTDANELMFYYEHESFRGFVLASDLLGGRRRRAEFGDRRRRSSGSWADLFGVPPPSGLGVVLVWASWSPHIGDAARNLQTAVERLRGLNVQVEVTTARVPWDTATIDVSGWFPRHWKTGVLSESGVKLSGVNNQIPSQILFNNAALLDVQLGAQSPEQLASWVVSKVGHLVRGRRPVEASRRAVAGGTPSS